MPAPRAPRVRPDGRPRPPATAAETLFSVRRWFVLHRRAAAAALAFCSVLLALQVLAPHDTESSSVGDRSEVPVDADMLQFPLRLSDDAVADLLSPGDVVDVLGSEARGAATMVAQGLRVVEVPQAGGGSFSSDETGLVVVEVSEPDALDLAAAVAGGPVTVTVHP